MKKPNFDECIDAIMDYHKRQCVAMFTAKEDDFGRYKTKADSALEIIQTLLELIVVDVEYDRQTLKDRFKEQIAEVYPAIHCNFFK